MNRLKQMIIIGAGVVCLSIAAVATAQTGLGLFEATQLAADAAFIPKKFAAVNRSRYVKIGADQLQAAADALPDGEAVQEGSKKLRLNFFTDVDYSVSINRKEIRTKDDYTLFGTIENVDFGHCTLVVQADKITGNCSSTLGMYQIRYVSDEVHVLNEIDQSRFPPEAGPIMVPGNAADADPLAEPAPDPDPLKDGGVHPDDALDADDGGVVDMLVVYTPAAASASSNIVGEIQLAISETNQAYLNSQIPHRVRLVGTSQISYTESNNFCTGSSSDLSRLRGTTDGYMDTVHSLRNSVRADQVTLIVETGDACGCAYYMDPVSSSFESDAFSVVRRDCSTGYFSFGHELGHNMSAHHDCYVHSGLTPYYYGHGYVNLSSRWRTVMAYNTQCDDAGVYCTRIQYFSNPAVSYAGSPTGTSGASGCQANNKLVHQNTDLTVSRFRDGICYASGTVERVTQYDDSYSSNSYVYLKPYPTSTYYQYFRTTDDNMASTAARAAAKKTDVAVRGGVSCLPGATDFGGVLDYIIVNP